MSELKENGEGHAIMYSAFMQFNEVFVTGGTGLIGRHVCRSEERRVGKEFI